MTPSTPLVPLIDPQTLMLRMQHYLDQKGVSADSGQLAAMQALAQWFGAWSNPKKSAWLKKGYDGVYVWGPVGRGKSLIMDAFHHAIPEGLCRRVHFHAFLQEIQSRLRELTGQPDPLALVARQLSEQTPVLCFDEFHVHDMGDAVLLGRLLAHLKTCKMGLVITSNYAPADLCPNPLYRERFKPAILLLQKHFKIMQLDGGQDYRQQEGGPSWGYYSFPWDDAESWLGDYLSLSDEAAHKVEIEVNRRAFFIRAHEGNSIWLEFDPLCRQARSSGDFLWLCQNFSKIVIDQVPRLDNESIDVQQRFLNFIDIAYDQSIELLIVGACALEDLLSETGHVDFSRTHSRLSQLDFTPACPSDRSEVENPLCSPSSTSLRPSSCWSE